MIPLRGWLVDFQAKFGSPDETNSWPLLREEVVEVKQALDHGALSPIARELSDVVYLAYGIAASRGINLDEALREVHRANMDKVPTGGKPTKPPDWVAPRMDKALP